VLNWQRYDLLKGQDNIAGIAPDIEPGTQFANMTVFCPNVHRIGVIYSEEHSSRTVAEAGNAAAKLGVELVTQPISHPKDFERAYKKLAGRIDVFWILTDPVVYTLENVSWLEARCIKDRLACIGQSENIAKLGMLLAIDPDILSIGAQAASIAKSIILRDQNPKKIGVAPPLGTRIFLNMKTAREIGVTINSAALNITSEIIEK